MTYAIGETLYHLSYSAPPAFGGTVQFLVTEGRCIISNSEVVAVWCQHPQRRWESSQVEFWTNSNFIHKTEEDAGNHARILSDMHKEQGYERFTLNGHVFP